MTNELISRFRAELPRFWKKVRKYALTIGGSAGAVLLARTAFGFDLNPTLFSVLGYVVAVCAAVAGTAQLTKE
jgi:hypothetical protein